MTTENLQGDKPQIEVAEVTPKEEPKPTQKETKPTVGKTFTQEELDTAVGKGVSSLQQQLSISKAEADSSVAAKEATEADLKDVQQQLDELAEKQFFDDPEARKAYKDRTAIARKERELKREKAELQKTAWAISMFNKAKELSSYGIPIAELETCKTEQEMVSKTMDFLKNKPVGAKEAETPPTPQVDTGVSTAGGTDWGNLSPDRKISKGLEGKI